MIKKMALFDSFVEKHFGADEEQQYESYPRDEALKNGKCLNHGVDAEPADKRHEKLENSEDSCNENHPARFHAAFIKSVGKRNGKCVHRKTDSKTNACDKKGKIHL